MQTVWDSLSMVVWFAVLAAKWTDWFPPHSRRKFDQMAYVHPPRKEEGGQRA